MARRSPIPRNHVGKAPTEGMIIATHKDGWVLYHTINKQDAKEQTWVNVKLITQFQTKGRANYWLSFCLERGDFRLNRDMRDLDLNYPDILPWVAQKIVDFQEAEKHRGLQDLMA